MPINTSTPVDMDGHIPCTALSGRTKEAQARSCHQEVVRQTKASLAAAESSGQLECSTANGYLAAAKLAVDLKLPGVADQALKLAGGALLAVQKTPFGVVRRFQGSGHFTGERHEYLQGLV